MIKTVPNCCGCGWEFAEACYHAKQGYHVATMKDDSSENICKRGHYRAIIVDDEGKLIMW